MVVTRLAVGAVRHRPSGFLAAFASTWLGATILLGFSSMLDVAAAPGVDATSAETLATTAFVAGGWCLAIVVFAVASTLTLAVGQRAEELALLKSVGATPGQLRRMVVGEAAVVASAAALLAIPPGAAIGWSLLRLLKNTGQVAPGVGYRFGPIGLAVGVGVTLLGATLAALMAARRTARLRASEALTDAAVGRARLGRGRALAAAIFLTAGAGAGAVTATAMRGEGSDAMQSAGQASIWASIGLALLGPPLLRAVAAALSRPLLSRSGPSGWLAELNVRARSRQHAAAVIPVVLFTGISLGTISMQLMENGEVRRSGTFATDVERSVATLNLVVVGMIALFAAIMLVNTLVAAVTHRRREFAQQRLAGATPGQVVAAVGLECLVIGVTGALLGVVASLATVVPYGIARTGGSYADVAPAVYPSVIVAALAATLVTGAVAAARAVRSPAVAAVAT